MDELSTLIYILREKDKEKLDVQKKSSDSEDVKESCIPELKAEIECLKNDIANTEVQFKEALQEREQERAVIEAELEKKQLDVATSESLIVELKTQVESLASTIAVNETRWKEMLEEKEQMIQTKEDDIGVLKNSISELQASIEGWNCSQVEWKQLLAGKETELQETIQQLELKGVELGKVSEDVVRMQDGLKEMQLQLDAKEASLKELETSLEQKLADKEKEVEHRMSEVVVQMQDSLKEMQLQLDAKEANLKELETSLEQKLADEEKQVEHLKFETEQENIRIELDSSLKTSLSEKDLTVEEERHLCKQLEERLSGNEEKIRNQEMIENKMKVFFS